jgi:hypothetical protein
MPARAASPASQPAPLDKPLPASAAALVQPSGPTTSVLERFRTHTGPRTPAALTALFDAPIAAGIRQQPAVVLSDGATPVTISVAVGSSDSRAPNVAFNGAQLISLKRSKADEWDIEALPAVGTWNASLLLLTDSTTREIPLTVAPALPKEIDLSERGFIAFLGDAKASAQPPQDLNDDGRHDYLDDFIFAANYLVRPQPAANVPGGAHVPEPPPVAPEQGTKLQAPDTGQAPAPPVSNKAPGAAAQGATSDQTPYQRNLSIRNQRARELTERMRGNQPPPGAPAVAVPPSQ